MSAGRGRQTALLVLDAQTVIVEPAPESFFVAMRRAVDAADTHDRLMKDVFPAMATVLSAEEWTASVAH
jgi:hypothetical protein